MPYIKPEYRTPDLVPQISGELNYQITRLVDAYIGPKLTYGGLNEVVGVLECVKLELYRRLAAPYEDRKCAENGDVYRVRTA